MNCIAIDNLSDSIYVKTAMRYCYNAKEHICGGIVTIYFSDKWIGVPHGSDRIHYDDRSRFHREYEASFSTHDNLVFSGIDPVSRTDRFSRLRDLPRRWNVNRTSSEEMLEHDRRIDEEYRAIWNRAILAMDIQNTQNNVESMPCSSPRSSPRSSYTIMEE